ncbi:MAG: hypothetical protein OHK93_008019 [Ramalina farinacea]|uniref:Carrier domain-containing protein n=1 Tax=Ramalina farinacea TaxID=258253 RepID=A0AA43QLN1_9LECA|nr:hypothetical protein [Ramalina farinacea]
MLDALKCETYLTSEVVFPVIKSVLSERRMKHITVPELEDWLGSEDAPSMTFEKSFEDARHEVFVISHTSGSTGVPKLVEVTHGTFAAQDSFQSLPSMGASPTILESFKNIRMHLGLPLFHSAAYFCFFSAPVYYDMTSVVTPAVSLTAEIAYEVHRHGRVQACCLPPSILVDISKSPEYLQGLKGMDFAMYGGGPLPKPAGDINQQVTGTRVFSLLGTTETMLLPLEYVDKVDWEYHRFSDILGAEFRHWWGDLYELVIVRDPKLNLSQAAFATLPKLQEFSPGDVYSRHPTKEGLWRYSGRTDDVIVFVNGEKLNPLTMEGIIGSHPQVRSALMYGTGRFRSGVLLELQQPTTSDEETAAILEDIWPSIELANENCPTHGQILKGMAILTDPEKPMIRAGKGTIQRGNTLKLYEKEISALYEFEKILGRGNPIVRIQFEGQDTLRTSLREFMSVEIGLEGIQEKEDFFAVGLDSLKAMNTVRLVNAAAEDQGFLGFKLTAHALYTNASVEALTETIWLMKDHCRLMDENGKG